MRRQICTWGVMLAIVAMAAIGCQPQAPFHFHNNDGALDHSLDIATQIEYPDYDQCSLDEVDKVKPPLSLDNPKPEQMWELSLEEAMRITLCNSTVIRQLGGVVTDASTPVNPNGLTPQGLLLLSAGGAAPGASIPTMYTPALTETDPRFGVEAALSAFDAQFAATMAWESNVTPENTSGLVSAFQPQVLRQDTATFQSQLQKFDASGGTWTLGLNAHYDKDNIASNLKLFNAEYDTTLLAEFRQPLLQARAFRLKSSQLGANRPAFCLLNLEVQIHSHMLDRRRALQENSFPSIVRHGGQHS